MCSTSQTVKKGASKRIDLDTLELTADFLVKRPLNLWSQRQKAKSVSTAINGKLCYLNSDIHKDYQKAYYCNEYLFQDGKQITADFCKKRNCIVCSRIKAAKLMAAYAKPLLELGDLYLVTLTAPNVKGADLSIEIQRLYNAFKRVKDNIRKNHKDIQIKGFRKLEVTYSERTKKFNPHYHIILRGKETAEKVRQLWLKQNPSASIGGQDIRPVRSKKALLEVFKYITKAIVKDTFDTKALDQMYTAIKGVRTYQSMGVKKIAETKQEKYESAPIEHRSERIEVWKWCQDKKDWYSPSKEKFNDTYISQETKRIIKIVDSAIYEKQKEPEPIIEDPLKSFRGRKDVIF